MDDSTLPKNDCQRISIIFENHSYTVCLSSKKIYVVKRAVHGVTSQQASPSTSVAFQPENIKNTNAEITPPQNSSAWFSFYRLMNNKNWFLKKCLWSNGFCWLFFGFDSINAFRLLIKKMQFHCGIYFWVQYWNVDDNNSDYAISLNGRKNKFKCYY